MQGPCAGTLIFQIWIFSDKYHNSSEGKELRLNELLRTMKLMTKLIFRLARARSPPDVDGANRDEKDDNLVFSIVRSLLTSLASLTWKHNRACCLLVGLLARGMELLRSCFAG